MATKKKAKPITRGELEGMGHKEIAKVATKRRILASLPDEIPAPKSKAKASDERPLTPRERMMRGHAKNEEAHEGQRNSKGDGDDE